MGRLVYGISLLRYFDIIDFRSRVKCETVLWVLTLGSLINVFSIFLFLFFPSPTLSFLVVYSSHHWLSDQTWSIGKRK
jgi:hypothetical protein